MPHQNSVMHDLLKHFSWGLLDRLAAEHGLDTDGRDVTARQHLIAMLYGQLSGAASLRELVTGLASHAASVPPSTATLSSSLNRPWLPLNPPPCVSYSVLMLKPWRRNKNR